MRRRTVLGVGLLTAILVAGMPAAGLGPSATAATQNDGGSGHDAGDTFAAATAIAPHGSYSGRLKPAAGDGDDFFKFPLALGASTTILITLDATISEPVELLDPAGRLVDGGVSALGVGASANAVATQDPYTLRVAVHHAVIDGDYRVHLQSHRPSTGGGYALCFNNCEGPVRAPIDMIFGGSLTRPRTKVLLVPPAHGDLGNPAGPTVIDYIDATLRGLRRWPAVLHEFADDHPEYAYLKDITVEIEVFDGVSPLDPGGYDVVIGYVAAGPVFRGVASDISVLDWVVDTSSEFSGRVIALSLYGSSPRAGQMLYDFPEVNDLETVTLHEFAHTFGLGHTTTWHPTLGPDLMNSPATFVYGDGWAAGDGGNHTPLGCITSLDLVGMANLYRWLPSGSWQPSYGTVDLPADIPYTRYC